VDVATRTPPTRLRALAALLAVFWGYLWFGLLDLLVVLEQDESFHRHYLLESGWGLLFLALVTSPLVRLCRAPRDAVALAQVGVCAAAVLVGAVWGTAWPQALVGIGLGATAVVLAGTWPPPRPRVSSVDRRLAALGVLGLAGAVVYGWPLARSDAVPDVTNGVSHYPMQASLGLATAGVVVLAATTASWLPAGTAAFAAIWLGVESVVYPHLPGSLHPAGGWATVVWGLLVVGATWSARRTRDAEGPSGPG
jgi:hypothetical protein